MAILRDQGTPYSQVALNGERKKQERLSTLPARLMGVYNFANEFIPEGGIHFDVGAYDGIAFPELVKNAWHVLSIDISGPNLRKAALRDEVQQGKVSLMQMDAKDISLDPNTFDSATIVEVFGAGFKGNYSDDVIQVFEGVHRVLKPGGTLIFTVKSEFAEELARQLDLFSKKGVVIPPKFLEDHLDDKFDDKQWYGQMIAHDRRIPDVWKSEDFVPKQVTDPQCNPPLFWVGVWQKGQ